MCQCPSTGNLHFYWSWHYTLGTLEEWCQCPSTGNLHFYKKKERGKKMKRTVSMPFNGQSPFLQDFRNGHSIPVESVSMPFNGQSPFLPMKLLKLQRLKQKCVNALQRAISISTSLESYIEVQVWLCQCPSTGNLHFYVSQS